MKFQKENLLIKEYNQYQFTFTGSICINLNNSNLECYACSKFTKNTFNYIYKYVVVNVCEKCMREYENFKINNEKILSSYQEFFDMT